MARGFTIIELVIVLAVISILAAMTLPLGELAVRRIKERELKAALWEIRGALDRHKRLAETGRVMASSDSGYPRSLDDLVEGVTDAKTGERLYLLRRIPSDPMSPASGWGLRSYASPPDKPQAGNDVYDVYSLSPQSGINGVPYAKW